MKAYVMERRLEEYAKRKAETVTIRRYFGGCSRDEQQPSTKAQYDAIYSAIYGALLNINFEQACRREQSLAMLCAGTAEFVFDVMMENEPEEINGYDSVYRPIMDYYLEEWEEAEIL